MALLFILFLTCFKVAHSQTILTTESLLQYGYTQDTTEMNLKNMNIIEIEPSAFSTFTKLEIIDLTNNKITSLDEVTFQGLANLKELYLSANQISQLPGSVFNNLNSLEILDLTSLKFMGLFTLPVELLQGLTN